MISLQQVCHRTLLRDISAEFPPGKVTMIVGPNGAGKSTLIRIMAGLLPASSGRVLYDGEDIARMDLLTLARRRALLSQHLDATVDLPVRQVVAM
jgi:iron complex transport system ATP-binding protein